MESSSRSAGAYVPTRHTNDGCDTGSWLAKPAGTGAIGGSGAGLTICQLESFLRRSAAASASSHGSSPPSGLARSQQPFRSAPFDAAASGQAHSSDEGTGTLLGGPAHAAATGMLGQLARRATGSSASMDVWVRNSGGGAAAAMAAGSNAAGSRPGGAAGMSDDDGVSTAQEGDVSNKGWAQPGSAVSRRGSSNGAGPVRAWLAAKPSGPGMGSDEELDSDAGGDGQASILQDRGAGSTSTRQQTRRRLSSSAAAAASSQAAIAAFAANSTALLAQAKALASGLGSAWGKAPAPSQRGQPSQTSQPPHSSRQPSTQRSILASPHGTAGAAIGASIRAAKGQPEAARQAVPGQTATSAKGQGATSTRPSTAGSNGNTSALKARYKQLKHDK